MTNKELEKKIEELSAQIEELKGEMKEETPKGEIWKPQNSELCWFMTMEGDAYAGVCNDDLLKIGNVYPTREKAEFEAQREKYTRLFRQYVEQHSEPLDWENDEIDKWYISYDFYNGRIRYWQTACFKGMGVYGSSEEVMREAVAFIGEENMKRYILSVEE